MKAAIRTFTMTATFLAVGITASACMSGLFGDDRPAPQQQQGPVVVPVINQSSDSGWFVLITIIIIGLVGAMVWMFRHAQREADRRRDAETLANRVLDALPDDMHREVTYALGYRPEYQVHRRASIDTPRAIDR